MKVTNFATLEPQTRFVTEKRIKKQWRKIPEGVQARVLDVLREVERSGLVQKKHRKVGKSSSREDKDEAEVVERQDVIETVVQRMNKRITRMPFPPGTQEGDFDYETLLNKNRSLEAQLTANSHSVALLRAEIEKEKKALALDGEDLEGLNEALKDTERIRKRQAKNFHPLAKRLQGGSKGAYTRVSEATANPRSTTKHTDLQLLQNDSEVRLLMVQLRSHLESMGSNIYPVKGIAEAITRSKSILDLRSDAIFDGDQLRTIYRLDGS